MPQTRKRRREEEEKEKKEKEEKEQKKEKEEKEKREKKPKHTFTLPTSVSEWEKEVKLWEVPMDYLHTVPKLKSGSKVDAKQFLGFRVIWPLRDKEKALEYSIDEKDKERREKVRNVLANMSEYREYLRLVENHANFPQIPISLGPFWLVSRYQYQTEQRKPLTKEDILGSDSESSVSSTSEDFDEDYQAELEESSSGADFETAASDYYAELARRRSATPATQAADQPWATWKTVKDETIVNSALLAFLNVVTGLIPEADAYCDWDSSHSEIRTEIGKSEMRTKLDGHLRGYDTDDVFAIVEVKPRIRDRASQDNTTIHMQESAEMINWILSDRARGRKIPIHKRLLVSQDRHEIRLVWATENEKHTDFLQDGTGDLEFLIMEEQGPFDTNTAAHMNVLAQIIGSYCLKVADDLKAYRATLAESPESTN